MVAHKKEGHDFTKNGVSVVIAFWSDGTLAVQRHRQMGSCCSCPPAVSRQPALPDTHLQRLKCCHEGYKVVILFNWWQSEAMEQRVGGCSPREGLKWSWTLEPASRTCFSL